MSKIDVKITASSVTAYCRSVEAKTFNQRFIGLMGKRKFAEFDCLYFKKCGSIHTFFMRMEITVVFTDAANNIIRIVRKLKPWRISVTPKGKTVYEFPADFLKAVPDTTLLGKRLDLVQGSLQ